MPYVNQDRRGWMEPHLEMLMSEVAAHPGNLNYAITMLCIGYLRENGTVDADNNTIVVNYEMLNAVVGALESAKAEFQRRAVAPYEDLKIAQNGDVYPTVIAK